MEIAWYDGVGTAGVVVIIVAYWLLTSERIDSRAASYSWLNLIGACLILVSLFHTWNTASVLIEVFWVAISLYGLWRAWRRQRSRTD